MSFAFIIITAVGLTWWVCTAHERASQKRFLALVEGRRRVIAKVTEITDQFPALIARLNELHQRIREADPVTAAELDVAIEMVEDTEQQAQDLRVTLGLLDLGELRPSEFRKALRQVSSSLQQIEPSFRIISGKIDALEQEFGLR